MVTALFLLLKSYVCGGIIGRVVVVRPIIRGIASAKLSMMRSGVSAIKCLPIKARVTPAWDSINGGASDCAKHALQIAP